jgi:hypothetical protein
VSPAELPESVLHTVIRTRESVILDDASAQNPFLADEYICQKHARSVLCLPLAKQAKLIGVLYLENNLAPHVFTPARISSRSVSARQRLKIGRCLAIGKAISCPDRKTAISPRRGHKAGQN